MATRSLIITDTDLVTRHSQSTGVSGGPEDLCAKSDAGGGVATIFRQAKPVARGGLTQKRSEDSSIIRMMSAPQLRLFQTARVFSGCQARASGSLRFQPLDRPPTVGAVFKCRTRPTLHYVELFRVIKFDTLSTRAGRYVLWPVQRSAMWHKWSIAQPPVPLTLSRLPIIWHQEVEP